MQSAPISSIACKGQIDYKKWSQSPALSLSLLSEQDFETPQLKDGISFLTSRIHMGSPWNVLIRPTVYGTGDTMLSSEPKLYKASHNSVHSLLESCHENESGGWDTVYVPGCPAEAIWDSFICCSLLSEPSQHQKNCPDLWTTQNCEE